MGSRRALGRQREAGGALLATVAARVSRVKLIVGASVLFGVLSIGMGFSPNLWIFYGFFFLCSSFW